jgi:hypothetical protein
MANKGSLSVADFQVAPRRRPKAEELAAAAPTGDRIDPEQITQTTTETLANSASASNTIDQAPAALPVNPSAARSPRRRALTPPSEEERRKKIEVRTIEQEDGRNRLRDLKRARQREAKHFVNVPLDYDLKKRLENAAHENDLKMTVIMKAAIAQFLEDNGY